MDMEPAAFETYRARNRDEKRKARRAALIAELRRRRRASLMRRLLTYGLPAGLAGLLLAAGLLGLVPGLSGAGEVSVAEALKTIDHDTFVALGEGIRLDLAVTQPPLAN